MTQPLRWSLLPLLWLLLWWPLLGPAAEVRASLDRPTISFGDSVTLTIERAGTGTALTPDLRPLDADFEVGGTSVSTEINVINGRRSDRTRFQVVLTPRREGTLTVPALRLGAEQTEPLVLTVEPAAAGATGAAAEGLFVEVTLEGDPKGLVINQQVPLVVRAYARSPLLDYELRLPALDGLVLTRLNDREATSMTRRNGEPYRVFEWRFTLSPERSGALTLGPFVFMARVEAPADPAAPPPPIGRMFRDPLFDRMLGGLPFGRDQGRPVRVQSEPLQIQVAGLPAGFTAADWLPARSVTVQDDWSAAPPSLAVGEPATRTVTLTADGLLGNQLPQLALALPDGARGYPGTTDNRTETDGVGVTGISRQQQTIIPTRGGTLELPAVRVPWWDTVTGERREAVLPALRLTVAGPVGPAVPATPLPAAPADDAAGPALAPSPAPASRPTAPLAVALGAGLLVAVVLSWWWWRRRRPGAVTPPAPPQPPPQPAPAADPEAARRRLQAACTAGDPAAAAKALLALGATLWPAAPPANLTALAGRLDAGREPAGTGVGLTQAIRDLERALYAPQGGPWDGAALWAAVTADLPTRPAAGAGAAGGDGVDLAPLYPRR